MHANINGLIAKAKSPITAVQTNNSHVITLAETKITARPQRKPDTVGIQKIETPTRALIQYKDDILPI